MEEDKLESMHEVLAKFGNMSSATVYFVLRHFLDSNRFRTGDLILSTALGPGFSSEVFWADVRTVAGLQAVFPKNRPQGAKLRSMRCAHEAAIHPPALKQAIADN